MIAEMVVITIKAWIVLRAVDVVQHQVLALKLQTYKPDTITLKRRGGDFDIRDQNSLWSGQNLHDLYTKAQTPWEWHRPIMERAARGHALF